MIPQMKGNFMLSILFNVPKPLRLIFFKLCLVDHVCITLFCPLVAKRGGNHKCYFTIHNLYPESVKEHFCAYEYSSKYLAT